MFGMMPEVSLKDVEAAIKELPLPEKIKAVAIYKRYQVIRKVEEEIKAANRQIEKQYYKKDEPILSATADIVSGKRGPTMEEIKNPEKYLTEEERAKIGDCLAPRKIQNYWSKCFNQSSVLKNSMGVDDELLLKHLEKISVVDEEGTDNFTIVFDFSPNDLIKNDKLNKKFYIKDDEAVKCEASPIEWKGKNLCMKEVKKKQKNKKTGQQRVVSKTVEAKSFFNFFRTIEGVQKINLMEATEQESELKNKLDDDFEIGGSIVDQVMPYSLEYYLGIEHDDGEGDDDQDEEDEQDSDGDNDSTDKKKKKQAKSKSKSKSKGKPETKAAGVEEKPECKQQ